MNNAIHLRSICAISPVESVEVGTYHFTQGPKSQVLSTTQMPTWQHFLEVKHENYVESWDEQKARPNLQA
jgi:hypothetical protein